MCTVRRTGAKKFFILIFLRFSSTAIWTYSLFSRTKKKRKEKNLNLLFLFGAKGAPPNPSTFSSMSYHTSIHFVRPYLIPPTVREGFSCFVSYIRTTMPSFQSALPFFLCTSPYDAFFPYDLERARTRPRRIRNERITFKLFVRLQHPILHFLAAALGTFCV